MKRGTPDHPKTHALATALGVGVPQAIGHLELLWHWTAKFAMQGDVGRWTDTDIERAALWGGSPGIFINALISARYLDADPKHRLIIHDWHEHADEATKKALIRKGLQFVEKTAENGGKRQTSAENGGLPEPLPLPEPKPEPLPKQKSPAAPFRGDSIAMVFDHWRKVMEHPDAKLTPERRKLIEARLKEGYSVEALREAVDGCRASAFHMGANDQQIRHDDLTLICRNGSKVERFRSLRTKVPPQARAPSAAAAARQASAEALIRGGLTSDLEPSVGGGDGTTRGLLRERGSDS